MIPFASTVSARVFDRSIIFKGSKVEKVFVHMDKSHKSTHLQVHTGFPQGSSRKIILFLEGAVLTIEWKSPSVITACIGKDIQTYMKSIHLKQSRVLRYVSYTSHCG